MNVDEWAKSGKPWNVILQGDCMDLMKHFNDKEISLCIVDPPYGIGDFNKYVGDSNIYKQRADAKYGDIKWNDTPPDPEYFAELIRISKNRIIWGANYYWEYIPEKNYIVWDKDNPGSRWSKAEIASVSIGVNEIVKFQWNGFLRCETVTRIHPCQKPVALYRWILQNYAKPGDKIIDTHSGSGSCAVACHLEKFQFLAIEKDEDYFNASVKRLDEVRAQGVLF